MVWQSIKMAWKSIISNKMRSFLTMLGIIIGVISLVVLVSIATSATSTVTDTISSLGSNMLRVTVSDDKGTAVTLKELSELAEYEQFQAAAPMGQTQATAKNKYNSGSTTVYGTTAAYYDIQGLELSAGRFLKTTDIENKSYVAVINTTAAETLFDSLNVIGETIALDGIKFTIIGLLEEDDSLTSMMTSGNMEVYIPYTTAARMSDTFSGISSFYVAAADEDRLDEAETVMTRYLLNRLNNDEDAFTVVNQSTIAETMSSVTSVLALLLGGIAGISLLVGGIGIMNIMLVSVTERTKEIGIRKSIGAGQGSIMMQFLIEALVISLLGCLIGVLMSWGIIEVVSLVAGDTANFTMSMSIVYIAASFSLIIGILFGIYPARKAAKKHPIEALRFGG